MVDSTKLNNVICADTVAEGTLKTGSDLYVEGHFTGNLHVEHNAYVSPTGRVIGKLIAGHGEIKGCVEGLLEGIETITLTSTASINGTLTSPTLSVEPGASLVAYCAITPENEIRDQFQDHHSKNSDHSNVRTVSFSFAFPKAGEVRVIGDFCDWDESKALKCYPSKNGHWSAQIQLLPGTYEYLVMTDGATQLDPTNNDKVENSFGGHNSLITIS